MQEGDTFLNQGSKGSTATFFLGTIRALWKIVSWNTEFSMGAKVFPKSTVIIAFSRVGMENQIWIIRLIFGVVIKCHMSRATRYV
jgi:hypothetical protein